VLIQFFSLLLLHIVRTPSLFWMYAGYSVGVGFDSNSKWFSNGQYSVCFQIEYLNRIEYFIRTVIVYIYIESPSEGRRKVRGSTYALRTSKNIRFEFEMIFECRKIRKTLKFSNFESIESYPYYSEIRDISCLTYAPPRAVCCTNRRYYYYLIIISGVRTINRQVKNNSYSI
jgi:hypothetical protein